jgi:O-antigen/teichoic acid export membrane protein
VEPFRYTNTSEDGGDYFSRVTVPTPQTVPTSQRVARNGALYFGSLALPALAAVFLVPVTVRALGPSRFGLLALAWALAEGAGMFDFGLARTTVRFVADATARGAERLREIILVSVLTQTVTGLLAGTLLFVLAPLLVKGVFTISAVEIPEAIAMFRVLAFHVPVLLALASLRAALEGAQRFDISTALRVPGSLASVIVPAIAAPAGASLATILWILLAVRLTLAFVSAAAVRRTLLPGRWGLPSGFKTLREMLGYSGWVAVSAALGPALGSIDRFAVGSVIGVTGLGYYTGAAEAANRFLLIPSTAFSALLPALAHTEARGERDRALAATRAAARQLATVLLPLCLALFTFAPAILNAWLGPVFAQQAGTALRILAVGVFLGGLAHLPLAVLYGAGRPDLPAKIHIGEVIVHVPLTFLLVKTWGITGAALAWTLRCGADWLFYEIATRRAVGRSAEDFGEEERTRRLLWLTLAFACSLGLTLWVSQMGWPVVIALVAVTLLAYAVVGWFKVLSDEERRAWLAMLSRARLRS